MCVFVCFGGARERQGKDREEEFMCLCERRKDGRGELNNCGGLVATIHTTDLILL